MRIPSSVIAACARQLGRPDGVVGVAVGRMLNRGNARMIDAAITAAQVEPGQHVADIGFGGGYGLGRLLETAGDAGTIYGAEISSAMLAQARRRFRDQIAAGRLRLIDAPMSRLPLPDACLDSLISSNTIYFIDDLPEAFAELVRVLRPGGRAVLAVGDPDRMAQLPVTRYGFRLRPISEVSGILREAGLETATQQAGSGPAAPHLFVSRKLY